MIKALKIFSVIFLLLVFVSNIFSQIKNVQILSGTGSPNEVSITINPTNPKMISAGSNLNLFYNSTDGGNTWTYKTMNSSLGVWGDPCLIYDADGNLFYAHLSNPGNPGYWIDRIVVQKSTNNGVTFNDGAGVGFSPPRKNQDKEWLAVDITNSPYRNNIYMAWTEFDKYGSAATSDSSRILFSRSTNRGESWQTPIRISSVGGDCIDSDNTVEGCVPAVGPNGEVYVSWSGPLGLMFDKSLDGGKTFGTDKKVAGLTAGWDYDIPGINRHNGFPVTACDISNSPYRGNVYINWADMKKNDSDIYFSSSNDGGNTWSAPKIVNNDFSGRHQFFTWMTVDPVTGIIYIIFYDRRNYIGAETEVFLARSDDGGINFTNHKISNTPFVPIPNVFFGDYTNIAAYDGNVLPMWMRMDSGVMSVWTAPMKDNDLVTSVYQPEHLPNQFRLYQNYPNPFNPTTEISWEIEKPTFVILKIYDMLGREIETLANDYQQAGTHSVSFTSKNLSSGIYYYRLETENQSLARKMILVK